MTVEHRYPYKALIFFVNIIIISFCILIYVPDRCMRRPNKTLYIVCTTSMLADLVSQIGGDHVHVDCLMGPGVDPHTYRARESDMHRLAQADMIFYHGLHLEGKMAAIFERLRSKRQKVIVVSDAIPRDKLRFISETDCVIDPHIWHDVALWRLVQQYISTALITHDPAHAADYERFLSDYDSRLCDLEQYIRTMVAGIDQHRRVLITAHDAFGYFGKAYGFQVVGLQGISTDSDIGLHDIARVVDIIIKNDIGALFVESLVSPRTIIAVQNAALARGKKLTVGRELFADALGTNISDACSYIDMMKHNINALVCALSK